MIRFVSVRTLSGARRVAYGAFFGALAFGGACANGCSSQPDSASTGASPYATTMANAFCGALRTCCEKQSLAYDPSSCIAQLTAFFQSDPRRGIDSVKYGNVIYDPGALTACANAYRDREAQCTGSEQSAASSPASSGDVDPIVAACFPVLRGTVAPGQPCTIDAECSAATASTEVACALDITDPAQTKRACTQIERGKARGGFVRKIGGKRGGARRV